MSHFVTMTGIDPGDIFIQTTTSTARVAVYHQYIGRYTGSLQTLVELDKLINIIGETPSHKAIMLNNYDNHKMNTSLQFHPCHT